MKTKQQFLKEELEGLRKVLNYLVDGDMKAFSALYFVKSNYKEWPLIIKYLKDNKIRGRKLVELFENASPDGGGYHLGVTFILSRMKGHKFNEIGIKYDQLH